uniref:Serine aminopeptidase S33 domain-containing protein n=1 Tax=Aplanochytrium stocchinoi TaxID=215587 RepID=A0A7S3LPP2_9STRA|mmetsp:Transcript_21879/g.26597  ORF Transcript_21879/g.26597 Transcript_21879/m.26597 type:complete len:174 (+) Transcript_21879:60-581(+)
MIWPFHGINDRLGERVSSLSLISSDAPYKRIGPEMIKRLYGVENLTAEIALQNAQTNYDHLKTSYLGMTKENRRKLAIEDVEEAVKQGLEGVAADSLLETGDWDFEISNIKSPVTVWHGKADTDVPVESSRFLVDLFPQTCQKKINYIEGESHSMIRRHWNSILEDLVSASKL